MGLRSIVNTHGADAKPNAMQVNCQTERHVIELPNLPPTNETAKGVGLTH
jgi:hypothetical protein